MPLEREEFLMLEQKARDLRKLIIKTVVWAGSSHIGGSLSAIDLLTILYYKYMNIDVSIPDWEDRDRFILSKGHIGVGFAPVLADKGYFPLHWLETFNHTHSQLGMYLDKNKVPGLDASTGSLGHGLPLAFGLALSAWLREQNFRTYCLLGDGESNEGSNWEAAMAISHYNLSNVIPIIDRNHSMLDGCTEEAMGIEPLADKWSAFGFHVIDVEDGNDMYQLATAIEAAHAADIPSVIIMQTKKGCGVAHMTDDNLFAGFDSEKQTQCLKDIDEYHDARMRRKMELIV
ncbi:transketolase [Oceanispirochaeta crateris]|uniref:Transketolase n=1 Tax=Oceanispirochaeta crateris TaxID=2518645 RepID=A0A5C1QLW4_9SPIO|nr:thiamine pyrophosphate-dependent enzyme [Oceanispirochaeta crateris]QEN08318.1 transketolase [Oceanispirochaeta crateris]